MAKKTFEKVEVDNQDILLALNNLEYLGVEVNLYVVLGDSRNKDEKSYIIAVGVEEYLFVRQSDLVGPIKSYITKLMKEYREKHDKDIEPINHCDRMPYIQPDEEINDYNIYLLAKYKDIKALKDDDRGVFIEESQRAGVLLEYDVENGKLLDSEDSAPKNREELETNICYIFENKPSTNSLALSKQFSIKHSHVMGILFEILREEPSYFNHIHFNMNAYKSGKNSMITSLHLEVGEKVYQKFIRKLGTPKSKEMYVYRERKMEEYYVAFTNMRDDFYRDGGHQNDIANIIANRKSVTEKLFSSIYTYITEYNRRSKRDVPYSLFKRIINNLANKAMGVSSLDKIKNRDMLDLSQQQTLSNLEGIFTSHSTKHIKDNPKRLIIYAYVVMYPERIIGIKEEELEKMIIQELKEYKVGYLWDKLLFEINGGNPIKF